MTAVGVEPFADTRLAESVNSEVGNLVLHRCLRPDERRDFARSQVRVRKLGYKRLAKLRHSLVPGSPVLVVYSPSP